MLDGCCGWALQPVSLRLASDDDLTNLSVKLVALQGDEILSLDNAAVGMAFIMVWVCVPDEDDDVVKLFPPA